MPTDTLLQRLQKRFEAHPARHPGVAWAAVAARLAAQPAALTALQAMDDSGGEPDLILPAGATALLYVDCAAESPAGRRGLCYDASARLSRREHAPAGSALEWAETHGLRLLTEAEYHGLQTLSRFDLKTSSWIATPAAIRALGGALFCDCRYGRVFTYHNGAQSYYAARGFRGAVELA
ncbi:MAG: DUF4256 domain-containing protein [Lysobacterales bacterium]